MGRTEMYECERLFGIEEGLKIQEMVESGTGSPCPCKQGKPCLLIYPPVACDETAAAV